MGKGLSSLKNDGIGVNCCWNYGSPKLLLHLIEYRLDQFNNKHTKTAVNSKIQVFESCCQKEYLVKVWSFLAHSPRNDSPVRFFRNWTETILQQLIFSNFTNIKKYLVYWKCIMWAKYDLPIIILNCEKVRFLIKGLSKMLFFNFYFFYLSKFQLSIVKNLMEKQSFFIMDFGGSYKVLYVTNIFDLHTLDNETTTLWVYPFSTYTKFSEKLTFLNPWYRGSKMLVFRKMLRTC